MSTPIAADVSRNLEEAVREYRAARSARDQARERVGKAQAALAAKLSGVYEHLTGESLLGQPTAIRGRKGL